MDDDKLWPKGTIISGTMRNEDVIPALFSYAGEDYKIPIKELDSFRAEIKTIQIRGDWDSEYASEVCLGLFDILTEYVPEGYYCGSHPGDGADYGIWRYEDDEL